jgi:hypothetical protein
VGKPVADGLVEVLARDEPDEALVLRDEDPALSVPLAEDHRVRDGVVGRDEACRARHDLHRRGQRSRGAGERVEDELSRVRERAAVDGRGRLGVPTPAERARDRRGVELRHARAADAEHAPLHLDEADERLGVREVDDLVSEVGDPVDVRRPGHGRDEHLEPADRVALER